VASCSPCNGVNWSTRTAIMLHYESGNEERAHHGCHCSVSRAERRRPSGTSYLITEAVMSHPWNWRQPMHCDACRCMTGFDVRLKNKRSAWSGEPRHFVLKPSAEAYSPKSDFDLFLVRLFPLTFTIKNVRAAVTTGLRNELIPCLNLETLPGPKKLILVFAKKSWKFQGFLQIFNNLQLTSYNNKIIQI